MKHTKSKIAREYVWMQNEKNWHVFVDIVPMASHNVTENAVNTDCAVRVFGFRRFYVGNVNAILVTAVV